jgi:hypothetical protein
VRPSHGRPHGHRPIVRPSVRKRPRDNPDAKTKFPLTICQVFIPQPKKSYILQLSLYLAKKKPNLKIKN